MNSFMIVKQTFPNVPQPWRVIENVQTSEGPRARVVGVSFATEEEARYDVELREQGFNGSDVDPAQQSLFES